MATLAGRLLQVTTVLCRQAGKAGYRRLRGAPVDGHLLLRETFESLSGSFLKFGQILSLQIGTLPRQYCDALLALLDRVPSFSPGQVDEIFLQEFKTSPGELYREFDYVPIASASIGQVHRAVLHDGSRAAVKVQRPGVRSDFERDLRLLQGMVRLIFLFRIRRLYFMRDPVRELDTWTQDELDYRREAAYCQLLGENAAKTPTERLPAVYWKLTSTRVLTMEYLEGPSVVSYLRMLEEKDEAKLAELRSKGFDPAVFSSNVISNFLSDAFRFGVFHADLHPANLLILPDNVVGYVDFGIVALLTPEARRKQIQLTLAYSSGDAEAIYQGFLNICTLERDADLPGMRRRIEQLTAAWYQEPAISGKVRLRVTVTTAMMDLLSICQDYGVLVDREMIKYIRATILADGLVSRLAPQVDLARALRTVVEAYLAEQGRRNVLSSGAALAALTELAVWMEAGPSAFLKALNLMERGQFRLRTSTHSEPDFDGPLRNRALAAAAVWGVVVLVGISGGYPSWNQSPFFNTIVSGFVALLTLRLLLLLKRLSAR